MDLHLIPGAAATAEEQAAIDRVLGPGPGGEDLRATRRSAPQRHLLLPALHAAHARAGWLSPGALSHIAARLDVAPAEVYGVASFYALFSLEPRPPRALHVCDDIACRAAGAETLCAILDRRLGPEGRPAGDTTWHRSPCLGHCDRAPAAFVQIAGSEPAEATLAPVAADPLLRALRDGPPPTAPSPIRRRGRLLRRAGLVDALDLDACLASDGFSALRRAREMGPEAVIREVTASGLLGRGGAAFPMGRKWDAVARAPALPHHFVLNADESEPGTFKDRVLMEEDPFAVIEAAALGAFATGAATAWIYIRGEYPLAAERLARAHAAARARGLLEGAPPLEIRRGAGAYICGEETALFNSIEGFRGEPRQKPPFPVQAGLFGRPTAINNVETAVNALAIVLEGAAAFRATETKLYCVSGAVDRPGLYEIPMGMPLQKLLEEAGARRPKAVLLGGAAGTFLTPDEFHVPLSFEGVRPIGATLGSGVVFAVAEDASMPDLLGRIAAFFRDESCGQCVPCRIGTVRQEESLGRLAAGAPLGGTATELALLGEIGQCMKDASICGLGQTAGSAILSALRKPELRLP